MSMLIIYIKNKQGCKEGNPVPDCITRLNLGIYKLKDYDLSAYSRKLDTGRHIDYSEST